MNTTATTRRQQPASSSGRGRRHSPKTVARAREMAEAGWTPHEIQQYLTKSGTPVTFATVKAWVDEDYRRRRNHLTAEDQRRWRDKSGEHVKRRMVELRELGLTAKAISVVVELYHGRQISEEMVRYYLDREADRQAAAA